MILVDSGKLNSRLWPRISVQFQSTSSSLIASNLNSLVLVNENLNKQPFLASTLNLNSTMMSQPSQSINSARLNQQKQTIQYEIQINSLKNIMEDEMDKLFKIIKKVNRAKEHACKLARYFHSSINSFR